MNKPLNKLQIGERGTVVSISCSGAVKRHIIDMGITPGAEIIMKKVAPLGDPLEINVRGYELSLRKAEASGIIVEVSK